MANPPSREPYYEVHTDPFPANIKQLKPATVLNVLDMVDENHFDAAVESLRPAEGK